MTIHVQFRRACVCESILYIFNNTRRPRNVFYPTMIQTKSKKNWIQREGRGDGSGRVWHDRTHTHTHTRKFFLLSIFFFVVTGINFSKCFFVLQKCSVRLVGICNTELCRAYQNKKNKKGLTIPVLLEYAQTKFKLKQHPPQMKRIGAQKFQNNKRDPSPFCPSS